MPTRMSSVGGYSMHLGLRVLRISFLHNVKQPAPAAHRPSRSVANRFFRIRIRRDHDAREVPGSWGFRSARLLFGAMNVDEPGLRAARPIAEVPTCLLLCGPRQAQHLRMAQRGVACQSRKVASSGYARTRVTACTLALSPC